LIFSSTSPSESFGDASISLVLLTTNSPVDNLLLFLPLRVHCLFLTVYPVVSKRGFFTTLQEPTVQRDMFHARLPRHKLVMNSSFLARPIPPPYISYSFFSAVSINLFLHLLRRDSSFVVQYTSLSVPMYFRCAFNPLPFAQVIECHLPPKSIVSLLSLLSLATQWRHCFLFSQAPFSPLFE